MFAPITYTDASLSKHTSVSVSDFLRSFTDGSKDDLSPFIGFKVIAALDVGGDYTVILSIQCEQYVVID